MRFNGVLVPAALIAATIACPAGAAFADPVQHCLPQGNQQIDIVTGFVPCEAAYPIAAAFDRGGDKYQTIGDFTCYTGNAMTAPTVLSCVSGDTEFAVNEPAPGA
jgi:hypothetical protein